MGSFFRSEEMVLCEVFLQPDTAYETVADLGETGLVQFKDLNEGVNTFQRRFISGVKLANEMERKLVYMESEIQKEGIRIPELEEMPLSPNSREIQEMEENTEKLERDLSAVSESSVNLKLNYLELTELKHVLEKTHVLFDEQAETANAIESKNVIGEDVVTSSSSRTHLSFISGVIPIERIPGFERMLWRMSRGNVFLRHSDIEEVLEDPKTGNEIKKNVFVAFFQGEQLRLRVQKVCSGFKASIYRCPESTEERIEMLKGVYTRVADLKLVLNQTNDLKRQLLSGIAKDFKKWLIMVKKMKAVYHTMNMLNLDITNKCFIGICWIPVEDLQKVKETLAERSGTGFIPSFLNVINTSEVPPTFNRTNKFTKAFQIIIAAYGIASYREINPALYTIITFPFLFAVMFGDIGHGLIVTAFSAWMVIFEKKLGKNRSGSEIWNIFFGGRYLILLMGLFSVYTGFIYNDVFSKSINIFGSSWRNPYDRGILENKTTPLRELDPAENAAYIQTPYPFGMDPAWQLAESNKIIFQNSFKMKLSIIFGVAHMLLGVCLSVGNHLYFKNPVNIILEFIPQVLFISLLFLYMVVLMFIKWIMYDASLPLELSTRCAPSVLITFINMVLFKENPAGEGCRPSMYPYQQQIQMGLVAAALLCIPVLLLAKPIYIMMQRRKPKKPKVFANGDVRHSDGVEMDDVATSSAAQRHSHSEETAEHSEEDEPMSEIFIHQAIHTIEYILSTVSHTASYLRLWALSLAHGQLSEVLWNMVFRQGIHVAGFVGCISMYIIFAVWATFTIAILVLMEGLSAFLHTLRLHWVEFMTKFYTGSGYPFQPFSFKRVFREEEKED